MDTCVAPEARGRGLAGILMDTRIRAAEACGCYMVIGACAHDNAPMIRLLDSRGFKPVADAMFPDGPGSFYIKTLGV